MGDSTIPRQLVEYANTRIDRIAADTPGVVVYDFARLALEMGLAQLFDPRLDYISRMPFAPAAQIAIAKGLARVIRALHVPPAKCLVLDLDNTLWGGVLGEVGLGGIALGDDYPCRVYRDFQVAALAFRHRGVLLAIASKNNDIEARQVFEQHPDMVLRWEDFAAIQIHWKDKASSLRAIAEQLRIGLDALVFYDDSPMERAWVRNELPEVRVIEVSDDLLRRVAALESCEAFDQVAVSSEDRQRTILYEIDRQRELAKGESTSLSDFLSTLQIRVAVGPVDGSTLPRVAQLIAKTNQFNLTGHRSTEAELQAQLASGAIGVWLRASDRFGDYGLVGAAFAILDSPGVWRIDNFVMSCRILGRRVESALLAAIARRAFDSGAVRLIGDFVASLRNAAAQDFYAVQGFEAEEGHWVWDFARGLIPLPSHLIPTEGFLPAVGDGPPTLIIPTEGTAPGVGPHNVGQTPWSAVDPLVYLLAEPQILPIGDPRTVGPLPTGRPGGSTADQGVCPTLFRGPTFRCPPPRCSPFRCFTLNFFSQKAMTHLREIVANVLGVSPDDLQDTSSPRDFAQWDSAAHIEIVLSAEAEYGVSFTPEEMGEVLSVGALEAALRTKGARLE